MAVHLANDICCNKHCWGVTVKKKALWISIRANDWRAESAIITCNNGLENFTIVHLSAGLDFLRFVVEDLQHHWYAIDAQIHEGAAS